MDNEFSNLSFSATQLKSIEHTQDFLRQASHYESMLNHAIQHFNANYLSLWKGNQQRAQVGAAFAEKDQRLKQMTDSVAIMRDSIIEVIISTRHRINNLSLSISFHSKKTHLENFANRLITILDNLINSTFLLTEQPDVVQNKCYAKIYSSKWKDDNEENNGRRRGHGDGCRVKLLSIGNAISVNDVLAVQVLAVGEQQQLTPDPNLVVSIRPNWESGDCVLNEAKFSEGSKFMKGRILHQKYVLSFTSSVKIEIGTQTMVINISTHSTPFIIVANVQRVDASHYILWHYAFATNIMTPSPTTIHLDVLLNGLVDIFVYLTRGRRFTNAELDNLRTHLLPITNKDGEVTFSDFATKNMVQCTADDKFSVWQWLLGLSELISQKDIKFYWEKGWLFFGEKTSALQTVASGDPTSFILRFSDTKRGIYLMHQIANGSVLCNEIYARDSTYNSLTEYMIKFADSKQLTQLQYFIDGRQNFISINEMLRLLKIATKQDYTPAQRACYPYPYVVQMQHSDQNGMQIMDTTSTLSVNTQGTSRSSLPDIGCSNSNDAAINQSPPATCPFNGGDLQFALPTIPSPAMNHAKRAWNHSNAMNTSNQNKELRTRSFSYNGTAVQPMFTTPQINHTPMASNYVMVPLQVQPSNNAQMQMQTNGFDNAAQSVHYTDYNQPHSNYVAPQESVHLMNNEGAQIPIQVHDNHQMSYGHAPYRAEDMPTPRPDDNISQSNANNNGVIDWKELLNDDAGNE